MLELTTDIQANRKALILRDTTLKFDEYGVAEGWETDYDFSDYNSTATYDAIITITKYTYDGVEETITLNLSDLLMFDGVTDQSQLVFNVVFDGTDWTVVKSIDFVASDYVEITDGVYEINYTLETATDDVTFEENALVSAKAESIIDDLGINLDCKIFSAENTNLVQLIDILALDATMFIINTSDDTYERSTLLAMLKAINNAEYDYYND